MFSYRKDIKRESHIAVTLSLSSGATRNRTGDTRIFSPKNGIFEDFSNFHNLRKLLKYNDK